MYQNLNSVNSKLDKVMTDEQFNQIVEAIISGKYSWACLLILRFSGYNPLHYIPYRTYNRLMKTNREQDSESAKAMAAVPQSPSGLTSPTRKSATKLRDLCCLEEIDRQSQKVQKVKGGMGSFSLHTIPNLIWREFSDR
ncbi:MAG: HetP family heterocyst commitment protein [Cyanobacteria bacterium P01_G01_bin.67]